MKGGNAHPRLARERDHVVGTGIVGVDAIKHAADLAEMTVRRGERPQVMSQVSEQYAIDDLPHKLRTEDARVIGGAQTFEQANRRVAQPVVEYSRLNGLRTRTIRWLRLLNLREQLGYDRRRHTDRQAKQRRFRTPFCLALERERHGQHKIVVRVVNNRLPAELTGFAALPNDYDAGVI